MGTGALTQPWLYLGDPNHLGRTETGITKAAHRWANLGQLNESGPPKIPYAPSHSYGRFGAHPAGPESKRWLREQYSLPRVSEA